MINGLNGKTYANIQCRRCKWVGTESEKVEKPDNKNLYLFHRVCPRCHCKTFNLVNEIGVKSEDKTC